MVTVVFRRVEDTIPVNKPSDHGSVAESEGSHIVTRFELVEVGHHHYFDHLEGTFGEMNY